MSYFITDNEAVIISGSKSVAISKASDEDLFCSVCEHLNANDEKAALDLLNQEKLDEFAEEVYKVGEIEIRGRLGAVIREHYKKGLKSIHLERFVKNLYKNPSYRVVNQLFDFIEASQRTSGGFTITDDGYILGYKRVRNDFKDIYSGKFDNSPGQTVKVPRNSVDENPDKTCSTGLHFCAFNYLKHYGTDIADKIVLVKVHPADVVSIPVDYNYAKARCCKYEVVAEYMGPSIEQVIKTQEPVYSGNPEKLRTDPDKQKSSTFADLAKKVLGDLKDQQTAPKQVTLGSFSISELRNIYANLLKDYEDPLYYEYRGCLPTAPSKFRDKFTAVKRVTDIINRLKRHFENQVDIVINPKA